MVWTLGVLEGIWRLFFWFRVFKGSGCGVEGVKFSIVLWVQGLEGFPGFEAWITALVSSHGVSGITAES